jgi:RNA polymerase sigma factor (sigma-70 family)
MEFDVFIDGLGRRDVEAAKVLNDKYGPILHAHVRRVFPRWDLDFVKDAVQETLISILRHRGAFPPSEAQFLRLVRVVARRCAIGIYRRRRWPSQFEGGADALISSTSEPVDSGLERDELARQVRAAINDLPAIYRRVLDEYLRTEGSWKQIADELELEVSTVRCQWKRARSMLQVTLGSLLSQEIEPRDANEASLATVPSKIQTEEKL